jgi:hypothetical protein
VTKVGFQFEAVSKSPVPPPIHVVLAGGACCSAVAWMMGTIVVEFMR